MLQAKAEQGLASIQAGEKNPPAEALRAVQAAAMPELALHSSLFARISATTQDLLRKNARSCPKSPSELVSAQQLAACPQEFLCPISLDIMQDPVLLLPTGQMYDYHSLTHWFESGERQHSPRVAPVHARNPHL